MWEIHNEDCNNFLEKTNRVFDLVISSPPFNKSVKYSNYKDNLDTNTYLNLFYLLNKNLQAKTKPDSLFFLQLGPNNKDIMLPFKVLNEFSNWEVVNQIVWVKSGTFHTKEGQEYNLGQYTPINSKLKLHSCWEYVFILARKDRPKDLALNKLALGTPFSDKTNIGRWKGKLDSRCRGNLWQIPHETKQKRTHPCPFPSKLAENCIKISGKPKDSWILDPFTGVSNTGIAAKRLDMNFVGCDLSDLYCELSRKNLNE